MTIRLYVLPMERNTAFTPPARYAKYMPSRFDANPADNVAADAWTVLDYGGTDWGIAAVEGSAAVHTALAAQADVQQVPANLDNTVANVTARNTVRTFLENIGLPGNWVVVGTSWREIVRTVAGMILFGQRFDALNPSATPFGQQIQGNLAVQWQTIPQATRDAAVQAGESMGYNMGFITPTMIVRNVLKQLADLWGSTPVEFGLSGYNGGVPFTV